MNYRLILIFATVFGGLAVILGAFGAHALEARLTIDQLSSYNTGNDYQFYHTFLLLGIGILSKQNPHKLLSWAAICSIIGIILFSGSIYLLACKDILGFSNTAFIGPITPIGGLFFILAWAILAFYFIKKTSQNGKV